MGEYRSLRKCRRIAEENPEPGILNEVLEDTTGPTVSEDETVVAEVDLDILEDVAPDSRAHFVEVERLWNEMKPSATTTVRITWIGMQAYVVVSTMITNGIGPQVALIPATIFYVLYFVSKRS